MHEVLPVRMCVSHKNNPASSALGFTLIEAIIGLGTLTLFMVVCFQGVLFSRVAHTKAKEQAIAMDFLMHYVETLKGLPFAEVSAGRPINLLFDGTGGAPNLRIPANNSWIALDTADYQTFHPDLLWLDARSPRFRVMLETQSVGGAPHTRHLNITVEWDAPLQRGGRLSSGLDLIRVKDR